MIDFYLSCYNITNEQKKTKKSERKIIVKNKKTNKTTRLYKHTNIYQTIQNKQYYRSVTEARISDVEFVVDVVGLWWKPFDINIGFVLITVGDLCDIVPRGFDITESVSVLDDENELHRPLWRRSGEITSGIIPQKPFVEREFALLFDDDDELDDDEHDAALETADDDVLWIRGGGVGLFFLFIEIPFVDKHESVEWSRDVVEDFPFVINCWENVTFDGGFIDDWERGFVSFVVDEFVGEINAWRTINERDGDGQLLDNAGESVVDCVEHILVRVLDESNIEFVKLRVSKYCVDSQPFI